MQQNIKVTVIGGGVGGYPAAITAARLGAEVTLVEMDRLGGVCLNRGCIPTKSLIQSCEVINTIKEAGDFGIRFGDYKVDFRAVMNRKRSVVGQLRQGVEKLLAAKKIRVIQGTAELLDRSTVRIQESGEKVRGHKIIIATGSKPKKLNVEGADGPGILDSDGFLEMESLPKSAVIIGGGYIGVEFAQILFRMGVAVTIVELMDTLIPGADKEIAKALEKKIVEEGIRVITKAQVKKITHGKARKAVTISVGKTVQKCTAESVIVSVGREPDPTLLNVDAMGLALKNRNLLVNEHMETNVPGIYAAGDVVGGAMLAHVATAEGECAARNAMGQESTMNYRAIPSCIYTSPQVASVGLTEEQAREKFDIQVGRFPFHACGKALVLNQTYGMVKIVAGRKYGDVLGVHIIGPHATDLIAEAVLGMDLEMTVEELASAMHPHPTVSEAMMEAASTLCGGAIHLP